MAKQLSATTNLMVLFGFYRYSVFGASYLFFKIIRSALQMYVLLGVCSLKNSPSFRFSYYATILQFARE